MSLTDGGVTGDAAGIAWPTRTGAWDGTPPWHRLDEATAGLAAPLVAVDLQAAARNAVRMVARANGTPIRLATKSVRSRDLVKAVLGTDGYAGVLAFSLSEALWLARTGTSDDILLGYPTVDRSGLAVLCSDADLADKVTLTIDDPAHLDLIDSVVAPSQRAQLRICLDIDVSFACGPIRIGACRSTVRTRDHAVALARTVSERPGFVLVGALAYEAQVAGVPDRGGPNLSSRMTALMASGMKRLSIRELTTRRGSIVAGLREVADLEFVNGGGTGSIETTAADPSITEIGAGSGLLAPHLFDRFGAFRAEPAAGFALDVTRVAQAGRVVVQGGGWVASGPMGADRMPMPVHPEGLLLTGMEGAGEVQTPLRVPERLARPITLGDRVWFRHAKAGEITEHVNQLHLVDDGEVVATIPTYRGERMTGTP